jgi:hypothetical protein
MEVKLSASRCPVCGEAPGTQWIEIWVGSGTAPNMACIRISVVHPVASHFTHIHLDARDVLVKMNEIWKNIQGLSVMLNINTPGFERSDRGSRVRFPAGVGNFSLHHRVQNGSGAHPASYQMGTRGSFPGDKRRGVKLTTHLHLVPRSKNAWSCTSTLPIRLHGVVLILKKAQGHLYLYRTVRDFSFGR